MTPQERAEMAMMSYPTPKMRALADRSYGLRMSPVEVKSLAFLRLPLRREVRPPRLREWAAILMASLLVGAITLLITLTISMLLFTRKPAQLPAPARIHPVMPNVPE